MIRIQNKVEMKNVIHLTGISDSRDNYYRLPFEINDQDVLYEKYYDDGEFAGIQLGKVIDGEFINEGSYWLNDPHAIDVGSQVIWITPSKMNYFNLYK